MPKETETIINTKALSKKWIAKHRYSIIIVAILLIMVGVYAYMNLGTDEPNVEYVTGTASMGNVVTSITGSGQISDSSTIEISPNSTAEVTEVNVAVGESVSKGDVLFRVDSATASASLGEAKANLFSAEEAYNDLLDSSDDPEVVAARQKIEDAESTLENANSNYADTVDQQQTSIDNTYRTLLNSGIVSGGAGGASGAEMEPSKTNSTSEPASITGAYLGTKEGTYHIAITEVDGRYTYAVTGLETTEGKITPGATKKLGTQGLYVTMPSTLADGDSWSLTLPNTKAESYLSNYNAYETAKQNQTQALHKSQMEVDSAKRTLDQAKQDLLDAQANVTSSELASAAAKVATTKAQLQSAQDEFDATIITAPFDGVVTDITATVGQQISQGSPAVTLATSEKMVEITFNEVDVPNLSLGDSATITLDALEDVSLTGKVSYIGASAESEQGVVNYPVQIQLDSQDDRVKSGMTANATIVTDITTAVLTISNSAIKTNDDGTNYVEILNDQGEVTSLPITIGSSNDTITEITDGLSEGDEVITQTVTVEEAAAETASGSSLLGGGGSGFSGPPGF